MHRPPAAPAGPPSRAGPGSSPGEDRLAAPARAHLPPAEAHQGQGTVGVLRGEITSTSLGVRVSLDGDLDLATRAQIDQALHRLLTGGLTSIVIDLRRLRFLDSAGVHPIRRAAATAGGLGGSLRLVHARAEVQRVLDVTGLGHLVADDGP